MQYVGLNVGDRLERQLDAQITAGHHHAVGLIQDRVEIPVGQGQLHLGDYRGGAAGQLPHLRYVLAPLDERGGHVVNAHLPAQFEIRAILLGDRPELEIAVGESDPLAVEQLPATFDENRQPLAVRAGDPTLDQAVGHHHPRPRAHVVQQPRIVDRDQVRTAHVPGRRKADGRPLR